MPFFAPLRLPLRERLAPNARDNKYHARALLLPVEDAKNATLCAFALKTLN